MLGGVPEPTALLRYRYLDGSIQAAYPMWVLEQDSEQLVGWTPEDTEIMYWTGPDGTDPRSVPLTRRFDRLTTGRASWRGPGVLRVVPFATDYQIVHFWQPDGRFAGWYVNFESPKVTNRDKIDTRDWHLDLWIGADLTCTWKDEEEAAAALAAGHVREGELIKARTLGAQIIADPGRWLDRCTGWSNRPRPVLPALGLPKDWESDAPSPAP